MKWLEPPSLGARTRKLPGVVTRTAVTAWIPGPGDCVFCVGGVVSVPMRAVRLGFLPRAVRSSAEREALAVVAPAYVLDSRHRLKMVGVDASPLTALVVDREARRDGAFVEFVRNSVRRAALVSAEMKAAISMPAVVRPSPQPTSSVGFGRYVKLKPILERQVVASDSSASYAPQKDGL